MRSSKLFILYWDVEKATLRCPLIMKNLQRSSVDCLKITEDKSSENIVYTPDARLIIATCVMSRRRAWSPRLNISTVPRREGRSSRPSCTVMTKTQSSKPASWHHCSAKTRGSKPASRHHCNLKTQSLKPASGRVRNPRLVRFGVGIQNVRLEARVPTTEKLYVSVITALITGSTAHVMRRVNPHYRGFLEDSFTPETPINSSVCYWKGVKKLESDDKKRLESGLLVRFS